jgi:hypothetical protein
MNILSYGGPVSTRGSDKQNMPTESLNPRAKIEIETIRSLKDRLEAQTVMAALGPSIVNSPACSFYGLL